MTGLYHGARCRSPSAPQKLAAPLDQNCAALCPLDKTIVCHVSGTFAEAGTGKFGCFQTGSLMSAACSHGPPVSTLPSTGACGVERKRQARRPKTSQSSRPAPQSTSRVSVTLVSRTACRPSSAAAAPLQLRAVQNDDSQRAGPAWLFATGQANAGLRARQHRTRLHIQCHHAVRAPQKQALHRFKHQRATAAQAGCRLHQAASAALYSGQKPACLQQHPAIGSIALPRQSPKPWHCKRRQPIIEQRAPPH